MIHLQQNTLKQLLAMYRAFPGTFCFLSLFSAAATFNRTKTLSESAERVLVERGRLSFLSLTLTLSHEEIHYKQKHMQQVINKVKLLCVRVLTLLCTGLPNAVAVAFLECNYM